MAQNENIELFSNTTDSPVRSSHIQTNMANIELTDVPGGYVGTSDEQVFQSIKPKDSTDSMRPVTSDVIIKNAPSKMLLNQCKIVGMMEEFCCEDDEGMIRDRDFNKKICKVKRAASKKALVKNKVKRLPSAPVESTAVNVLKTNDPSSPVVIHNENAEFEWQGPHNEQDGDNVVTEHSKLPRNISTESFLNITKNVRNRRATALAKRDQIRQQASQDGFLFTARYIHFERFKSIWHNIKSISFWGGEMKHVESIFGTSVVSYFIFLRFIFLINFLMFIVMTIFVIVPQLLYSYIDNKNVTAVTRSVFKPDEDLLGLVTGNNWFEGTELFYGSYTNEIISSQKRHDPENAILHYRMPYAYLFTFLVILIIFLIALIYKLGVAFREAYGTLGSQTSAETCNRVFGAWDYGISNEKAAKLRHNSISTDLKEEIDEQKAKNLHRNWKEWIIVIILRIFFNILTFLLLAVSGVIIVFSTLWALAFRCPNPDPNQDIDLQPLGINLPGIINSFTIVILNFVLQFIFPFFAQYERFKSQSNELKMTLIRSVLIRLASLIVLTLTLFVSYLFIQTGVSEVAANSTQFNPQAVATIINDVLGTDFNITSFQCQSSFSCWETYFGQEFYRLAVTNFVFAIITTLFPEISRYLLHRFGPRVWNRASKIVTKKLIKKYADSLAHLITSPPEFYIAKSVLDLIYAQALMLLGLFFCPFLSFISMITFFVIFYVKKYSCVWFCSPSSRGLYRSARNNLFYILLLILIYFACLAAILYILLELDPSDSCGPFRDFDSFVGPIETHLTSQVATNIVDLVKSPGVTYSIITLLLLLAYAQYIVVGSYKKNVKSLRHRLGVESADKQYYYDQLVDLFNELESLRNLHNDILQLHYHSEVEYQFVFRDKLASVAESIDNAANGPRLSWVGTNERETLADRRRHVSDIEGIYERTEKRKH